MQNYSETLTNYFNHREKKLLTEFAANNGLELVNKNTPTWTNGNQETLIDHCLTTKQQFFYRDTRKLTRASLNKEIASAYWSHVSTKQCRFNF